MSKLFTPYGTMVVSWYKFLEQPLLWSPETFKQMTRANEAFFDH